jgi:hypothetical protein
VASTITRKGRAILAEDQDTWLTGPPDDAFEAIKQYPDIQMVATPVSTRVNTPKSNAPARSNPHHAFHAGIPGSSALADDLLGTYVGSVGQPNVRASQLDFIGPYPPNPSPAPVPVSVLRKR